MKLKDFVLNELKGVTVIIGKKGAGKTLSATMIAYTYWKYMHKKGYKVYANYQLNFPFIPVEKISTIRDAERGLLVIDEAYQIVDSRRASSGKNILITTLLSKARKMGIRVLFIAQYFATLDRRIRDDADWIIRTSIAKADLERKIPTLLEWEVYTRDDFGEIVQYDTFYIKVPETAFTLYDSYADIFPIEDDISEQKRRKSTKKRKT